MGRAAFLPKGLYWHLPPATAPHTQTDVRFCLLSWGQDPLLCPHHLGRVGRVAVKETGDVGCSRDCPGLSLHRAHLMRPQASSLESDFTSLLLLNRYPTCPRLPGPIVPCQEAHGFPPSLSPGLLNLCLLWARAPGTHMAWSTSDHFPLHRAVRGRRDQTSPAPGSSQTPGQQMSHQRQTLEGRGRDGQLLCCGIIVMAVIFYRPTVGV